MILRTYTGENITPVGKLKVKVKYENKRRVLDLNVVQNDNVPLFGRVAAKHLTGSQSK